jgi:hypothetical protein
MSATTATPLQWPSRWAPLVALWIDIQVLK